MYTTYFSGRVLLNESMKDISSPAKARGYISIVAGLAVPEDNLQLLLCLSVLAGRQLHAGQQGELHHADDVDKGRVRQTASRQIS